jgi:hypothetical protein
MEDSRSSRLRTCDLKKGLVSRFARSMSVIAMTDPFLIVFLAIQVGYCRKFFKEPSFQTIYAIDLKLKVRKVKIN